MKNTLPSGLDFFNFISNGPVIMYIYGNDRYVWTNGACQQYLGYSADELLNMNFWAPIHPDHRERLQANVRTRLRGGSVPNRYETAVVTKDGTTKWVDVFISEEVVEGQRYFIFGAYDITKRKQAQAELQTAHDHLDRQVQERTHELTISNRSLMLKEKLLMSVIANISDGVIIIARQGKIEFVNENLKIMLGKSEADIVAQLTYEKLVVKNPVIEQLLQGKRAFKEEEISLMVDGRDLQFLATGTPIEDPDGTADKGILVLKPLAEVHRLVNRYSGTLARFRFEDILTRSEIMQPTIELARIAGQNQSTVLIQGESGTGKEMFAQAIHNQSRLADGPFIAVNCGAIPRELIGSELFGYAEGAFTGARRGGSPGKFELANGGTLFLDEIGDMPLEQQVTLLRVLQEKQVCRLGGSKTIPVNVRVICATNHNLYQEVQKGTFRQDLFYRLNVISLLVPPLRERPEDIDLLLKHFLIQKDKNWHEKMRIDAEAWNRLHSYEWPGNVRELQNFAERIQYTVKDYSVKSSDLPREMHDSSGQRPEAFTARIAPNPTNIKQQWADLESQQIELLLKQFNGNVSRVAKELGVSRRTVDRRIKLYGLKK